MKYGLSTREVPRAEPEGFPEGTGYISPDLSHDTDILNFYKLYFQHVLPGRAILEELIVHIGLEARVYFPVLPSK